MDAKRWQYLKALRPHPGTLVFNAREAGMVPNPELQTNPDAFPKLVPWQEKIGRTFCENNNARKQANRENAARGFA